MSRSETGILKTVLVCTNISVSVVSQHNSPIRELGMLYQDVPQRWEGPTHRKGTMN